MKNSGFNVIPQLFTGKQTIDLAVPVAKVNIEVDGGQHNRDPQQALSDLKRTYHSFRKGYFTIRIPNPLVDNYLEETVKYIVDILEESQDQIEEEEE